MKREKQIKESKDLIKNALFRLLEVKDLTEITMSEIAKEAGLVRMTLYRHFKEKEQILLYCFETYLQQVLIEIGNQENPSLNDLLRFRFKVLKESPYTNLLMKCDQLDKLSQRIGKKFSENFRELLPTIDDIYLKEFVVGGIDAITIQWIEGGMKESYVEMADKITKIIQVLSDNKLSD
ncbi:TetR/AcrR family transcriptional regulator [Vallitalea sediminicola]